MLVTQGEKPKVFQSLITIKAATITIMMWISANIYLTLKYPRHQGNHVCKLIKSLQVYQIILLFSHFIDEEIEAQRG